MGEGGLRQRSCSAGKDVCRRVRDWKTDSRTGRGTILIRCRGHEMVAREHQGRWSETVGWRSLVERRLTRTDDEKSLGGRRGVRRCTAYRATTIRGEGWKWRRSIAARELRSTRFLGDASDHQASKTGRQQFRQQVQLQKALSGQNARRQRGRRETPNGNKKRRHAVLERTGRATRERRKKVNTL